MQQWMSRWHTATSRRTARCQPTWAATSLRPPSPRRQGLLRSADQIPGQQVFAPQGHFLCMQALATIIEASLAVVGTCQELLARAMPDEQQLCRISGRARTKLYAGALLYACLSTGLTRAPILLHLAAICLQSSRQQRLILLFAWCSCSTKLSGREPGLQSGERGRLNRSARSPEHR